MYKKTMKDFVIGVKPINAKNATINFRKSKIRQIIKKHLADTDELSAVPLIKSDLSPLSRREKRSFLFEKIIDLHGLTKDKAFEKLLRFFSKCQDDGLRKILVITGGSFYRNTILRSSFQKWISEDFGVFVSKCTIAKIQDGGEGAFYLILKKQQATYKK